MNGPRRSALLASVRPMLEPDERIEVVTIVTTSPVSLGRTTAFALASAVVSGGGMTMAPAPTAMHLVMTDRRFFLFRGEPMVVWPRELVMTFPRRPGPHGDRRPQDQLVLRPVLPGPRREPPAHVLGVRQEEEEPDSGGGAGGGLTRS